MTLVHVVAARNLRNAMEYEKRKILTLCIIHQHPRVLLGMKKRGFGQGKWNGFGGKIKKGESVEQAVRRELQEEAGVDVDKIERVGIIDFEYKKNPGVDEVHIFKGLNIKGEPQESEEMKPQWFHVDEIPFKEMWPDDKYWLPSFLVGKKFRGKFLYNESDEILDMDLLEVEDF